MASRPVYTIHDEVPFFKQYDVDFKYYSGFAEVQKKRSVRSLHEAYTQIHEKSKILEISSKSEKDIGIKLSAFNLIIETKSGKTYSVESAFQASKVFEGGGPFIDLLEVKSKIAKRDERLKNNGRLLYFKYGKRQFSSDPKTYFYNWLYINTVYMHEELIANLVNYDSFTDIEFNPKKSINCQAQAAAILVSLYRKGILEEALKDEESFLRVVYNKSNGNIRQIANSQTKLE